VFKLKGNGRNGNAVWAYRYRFDGRGSKRPQVGGFASRAEAQEALRRTLDRLRPGGRAATLTLADLVEEHLEVHQAEPTTIAKLLWLLAKATRVLGEVRVVDLRPEQVCAWRASLPESLRFAATRPLRQVLNRAVAWELIDFNPAKRGVANPSPRSQEKRPFDSWAEIDAVAEQLGPVYGPMVVFAAATGLRPGELFALEQRDVDRAAAVIHVRRAFAYGRLASRRDVEYALARVDVDGVTEQLADDDVPNGDAADVTAGPIRPRRLASRDESRRRSPFGPPAGRSRHDDRPPGRRGGSGLPKTASRAALSSRRYLPDGARRGDRRALEARACR
jgi:integrase